MVIFLLLILYFPLLGPPSFSHPVLFTRYLSGSEKSKIAFLYKLYTIFYYWTKTHKKKQKKCLSLDLTWETWAVTPRARGAAASRPSPTNIPLETRLHLSPSPGNRGSWARQVRVIVKLLPWPPHPSPKSRDGQWRIDDALQSALVLSFTYDLHLSHTVSADVTS